MKQFLKSKIKEATKQVQEATEKFDNDKNIQYYRGVRNYYVYAYRNPDVLDPEKLMAMYTHYKANQSDYYDGACEALKVILERLCKV